MSLQTTSDVYITQKYYHIQPIRSTIIRSYLKTFLSKFLRVSSRLSWQTVASYIATEPSFPFTFLFFPLLCLRWRKTLEYLEDNWLKLTKICNDKRLYLVTNNFRFHTWNDCFIISNDCRCLFTWFWVFIEFNENMLHVDGYWVFFSILKCTRKFCRLSRQTYFSHWKNGYSVVSSIWFISQYKTTNLL